MFVATMLLIFMALIMGENTSGEHSPGGSVSEGFEIEQRLCVCIIGPVTSPCVGEDCPRTRVGLVAGLFLFNPLPVADAVQTAIGVAECFYRQVLRR